MTDRRRRNAKLVRDVMAALDRGVSPEQVHAALLHLGLRPEKASLLLNRILAARDRRAAADSGAGGTGSVRSGGGSRWHRRVALFVAVACVLVSGGFAVVVHDAREEEAALERAAVQAEAARLDAELTAAREHMAYLQEQLEERRVDAEQVEWLRARVGRGPASFASLRHYEDMLGIYQRRRARWNRTLPQARVVADAFRTLAGIYNAKVDSLDALVRALPEEAPDLPATDDHLRIAASEIGEAF